MNDNEIIKALECCATKGKCDECPANPYRGNYGFCTAPLIKASYYLINRQKAEISVKNKLLQKAEKLIETERAEAIKELAKRIHNRCTSVELNEYIDSVVEEMVGEG